MKNYHTLSPTRDALHGQFSPELPPALVVDSGDVVCYRTLDVAWGMGQHGEPGMPRPKFEPRESPRDDGPALCGPVFVRGAKPGMTLEARIERLIPASWGWTWSGSSGFMDGLRARLGLADAPPVLARWSLDTERMIGESEGGRRVPLRPFLGTLGLSPGEPGFHSGWLPRVTGGNMDCKELTVGSRLFLPIAAEGALVSVGDGHAAQGDGEVGGSAIECMMEVAEICYSVHSELAVSTPRAITEASFITLGFGPTLDDAAAMALGGMLDWLGPALGMARAEALAFASVTADLRVTQMVNGVVGVHAVLPRIPGFEPLIPV